MTADGMAGEEKFRETNTHLLSQVALPELAVCSATSHGAQEVGVDLNDLLHSLRGCRTTHPCSA